MTRLGLTLILAGTLCFGLVGSGCGKDEKSSKKSRSSSDDESSNKGSSNQGSQSDGELDPRTSEAMKQLDKIMKGASVYYTMPHVTSEGRKLPCQFPASGKSTPAATCCTKGGADKDGDNRCDNYSVWDKEPWSSLNFQMVDQHHYVYEVKSSGTLKDAKMEIFAYGDLDCDGKMSTFKRTLLGDPQANMAECSMRSPGAIEQIDPNE